VSTDYVRLFTMTSKSMKIVKTAILRKYGVYLGQDLVLGALWRTDGLTPREVAGQLGLAVPTVVKMTQRMESAGLVSRRRDERDRRLVRIHLTDRGQELREHLTRDLAWFETQTIANLTEADKQVLERALAIVVDNMRSARTELGGLDELAPLRLPEY